MRRYILIGVSGAVLTVVAAWWSFATRSHGLAATTKSSAATDRSSRASRPSPLAPSPSSVSQAFFDPLEIAPCNLVPSFEQDVSSQVDGIFDEILVDVGRQVRKGDLLGQLDDRQLRAQVELLAIKANSLAAERIAKAQFDDADAKMEYARKANESGLRAVPELEAKSYLYQRDRYAGEIKRAIEEREAAQKELDRTRVVLQQHAIRAAMDGEIVKVYKRPGEAVKQAEPLFRITNSNELRVEGLCKTQQAGLIQIGMRALVEPEIRGEQMTQLIGHTGAITALAIASDGRLLASASEDRKVFLWNWPQGTRHAELAHDAEVTAVTFAPRSGEGYTVLTGCGDGQARMWQVPLAAKPSSLILSQQHEGPIRAVAFNAEGTRFATAGDDKRIGIWTSATGKFQFWLRAEGELSAHQGAITSLRFCPDGELVSAGRDNDVKVWKVGEDAGELVRVYAGRTCEVAQLGVSPDGRSLLFDLGEELRILDRDDGTTLGSFRSRRQGRFQGLAEFSPSGRLVLTASSNQRLQLWRVPPTANQTEFFRQGYSHGFNRGSLLTLSAWPILALASASDITPQLWNLPGNEIRYFVIPSASVVHTGVFAPDESVFFTAGSDKIVRVWAAPTPAQWQQPYEARITYVGNQIERGTDMVRIRAELENPSDIGRRLRVGSFATLRIFPETANLK